MSEPVAKQDDRVVGVDTHVVLVSSPGGPVPTPMPLPFDGPLQDQLSTTVYVDDKPVAVVGSVARNQPEHIPMGGAFQKAPANEGTVKTGSASVYVDDKPLARNNDAVACCNDPVDQQTGHIVASATVVAD